MKAFTQKYGFWILVVGFAVYWVYRQWPHNIAIKEIVIEDKNGQLSSLSINSDSVTVIHFFAHWCGPCMRELPEIAEYRKQLNERGIAIICITDDDFSFIADLRNRTHLSIFKTPSLKDLNVFSIPMTYIYNRKGDQVERIEGPLEWSNQSTFEQFLKNE